MSINARNICYRGGRYEETGNGLYYLGSLVYNKQGDRLALKSADFSSGRFVVASNSITLNYHITDHLGSVRVIVDNSGDVHERNDYYAFGLRWSQGALSENRYRYNGKEEQGFVNLPYTDYGARMYNPITGRWFNVDPLAELYSSYSPYAFILNNPIKYIDPNGMWVEKDGGLFTNDPDEIKKFLSSNRHKTTTDAGHGDQPKGARQVDPGTIDGTHYEKDYALMVEEQVAYYLQEMGVDNTRIRTRDIIVDGQRVVWRYKMANSHGSEILVSIHLNSGSKPCLFSIYGAGNANSRALADAIASQMKTLPLLDNGVREDVRGLGLLRGFRGHASVIIELG